ncbi:MAG TPA: hypothetical protein VFR65_05170 [Nitrososphaeraceae archaeon]|jgi:hypothetical protein|nr:hypothetical protein [Nitrososphaeraceae archaeon]
MKILFEWISIDGQLFLCARIVRTFADGFLSVIFAIYLKLIGFDVILIGIILSITLIIVLFLRYLLIFMLIV